MDLQTRYFHSARRIQKRKEAPADRQIFRRSAFGVERSGGKSARIEKPPPDSGRNRDNFALPAQTDATQNKRRRCAAKRNRIAKQGVGDGARAQTCRRKKFGLVRIHGVAINILSYSVLQGVC